MSPIPVGDHFREIISVAPQTVRVQVAFKPAGLRVTFNGFLALTKWSSTEQYEYGEHQAKFHHYVFLYHRERIVNKLQVHPDEFGSLER